MESPGSLLRHRDFRLLWSGQTVSRIGTEISVLALPLIAIKLLRATTFEVGALTAIETLPFLLIGLPAGAWVDRLLRRQVLIVADIGRLLALASVPIASFLASITLVQLFVVAFVTGALTVFFDVAYQSYLPELVGRAQLVDGNAKLAASESTAHVVGPGLGGGLISAVGAASAVVADAASYLVSLLCLLAIRNPSTTIETGSRAERAKLVADIREGLSFVLAESRIKAVALCTATANLFSGVSTAVVLVFMARSLGLSSASIGAIFAAGGVGAIAGAIGAPRLAVRIGVGPAIVASAVSTDIGPALVASATGTLAGAMIAAGFVVTGAAANIYNINQVSMRQALCPPRLLGRMNASVRFLVWGTLPLGGFIGGVLGSLVGLRATLWIAAAGEAAAFLWLVRSPVPRMREIPHAVAVTERTGRA